MTAASAAPMPRVRLAHRAFSLSARRLCATVVVLAVATAAGLVLTASASAVTFVPAPGYAEFAVGAGPYAVAVDDFNADGDPDLAVANLSAGSVSVLLGLPGGGFGPKTDFPTGAGPYALAVGDFNADGDPDLAVTNYHADNVAVLLGQSGGNFGPQTDFPVGDGPRGVTVGDFDADGDPDLAVTNVLSHNVSVLLNTTAITPGPSGTPSLPGVVRASTTWLLRDSLTGGDATTTFTYGAKPLVPIMGDWDGNGSDTPGTFESGVFKLSNAIPPGAPTITVPFGDPRGFPVVGDFNDDGFDDLAVYRSGTWQFRVQAGGVGTDGPLISTPGFTFGSGNWPATIPVAGDWDGSGGDGIGLYTHATGAWQQRETAEPTAANLPTFTYWAGSGSYPVVGDWNGDGVDSVGVKLATVWQLNDQNDSSGPDITFSFGLANDLPLSWQRPAGPPA